MYYNIGGTGWESIIHEIRQAQKDPMDSHLYVEYKTTEMDEGYDSVVEHLPSRHKAVDSTLDTIKTNNKRYNS